MTEPTMLNDMTETEQAEILLAWWRKRPLQWWNGEWIDREFPEHPLKEKRAYRLTPEPLSGGAYVNVYPGPVMSVYKSKADADWATSGDRIACVRIEWVEGQFDE
jgi:hypothetical protein